MISSIGNRIPADLLETNKQSSRLKRKKSTEQTCTTTGSYTPAPAYDKAAPATAYDKAAPAASYDKAAPATQQQQQQTAPATTQQQSQGQGQVPAPAPAAPQGKYMFTSNLLGPR